MQEASVEALIRDHLQDALAAGTEGLMLKALTGAAASYQPSKRSTHWLKIKRCALSFILSSSCCTCLGLSSHCLRYTHYRTRSREAQQ